MQWVMTHESDELIMQLVETIEREFLFRGSNECDAILDYITKNWHDPILESLN